MFARQRDVQRRGHLAQLLDGFQQRSGAFLGQNRDVLVDIGRIDLVVELFELLQRVGPALDRFGNESLSEPEIDLRDGPVGLGLVADLAHMRGDVHVTLGGEQPGQLQIGIGTDRDAAEGLQDDLFVENERGVALLGPQRAYRGGAGGVRGIQTGSSELEDAVVSLDRRSVGHQIAHDPQSLHILERIAAQAVLVHQKRKVIEVIATVGIAHGEDGKHQGGWPVFDDPGIQQGHVGDVAALATEPPLGRQSLADLIEVDVQEPSSATNWNQ